MFYLRDAEDDLEKLAGAGTEEKSDELYLTLFSVLRLSWCEV